jgi:cytidylate kinase
LIKIDFREVKEPMNTSFKKEEKTINIAIDGPAGAGKSTISKMVSARLGYIYVDTGALYRAVALYITENNIPDEKIAESLEKADVSLAFKDGVQSVFVGDRDVSGLIRTPEISMAASRTSSFPEVRAYLFETQKKIARENNVIMDGRDIGTVVLPDAEVKIFLTASAEERANRRYKELSDKPNCPCYEEILSDIIERDRNDMNRAESPLKQADDAIVVDTTELSLDESADEICRIITEKLDGGC